MKFIKNKSVVRIIVISLWGLFVLGILSLYILFSRIANGKIGYMPPIEELENPKNTFASEIYSADGKELGRYFKEKENRVFVRYNELSPQLVKALIATEDIRYTEHSGIDAKALFRVFVKRCLLLQPNAGGGSTISQQLAKQLFSPNADNIMERFFQKPIEWVIAVQLERTYTKEEIINMYLNKFDFLYNAVGIQSAAAIYFNTTPSQLTTEQAATLVGMCKNPSSFNPKKRPERALSRRNTVLELMLKAGYLTKAECDSLKQIPISLKFSRVDHKEGLAPYFREHLRMMMTARKPERKNYASWQWQKFSDDSLAWETNPLHGWCNKNTKTDGSHYNVYTDGLKIYTTIDSRMQRYAEEAVEEHIGNNLQPKFFKEKKGRDKAPFSRSTTVEQVNSAMNRSMRNSDRYIRMKAAKMSSEEIKKAFNTPVDMTAFSWNGSVDTTMTPMDSIRYTKHFLRSGFMSMDPRNGNVKAYVGGINFGYFQYDMVAEGRRQIGSTIKPFLYTMAMQEGFSPDDEMSNTQPHLTDENGRPYSPSNSSNKRAGEMVTLRWALANSNNWISARLMDKLSPYSFVRLLHSFGINNKIDPVISLCLGPAEVSVEEMVTAYSAFANKGIRVSPVYVTRIEDNFGNVISTFVPNETEVFGEETHNKILPMLKDVINVGTGARIRARYGIKAPMGGKTGTTNDNSDGWFMGFTPSLVSGTWVGGDDRFIHFDYTADGQGANMALPIYGIYMQKVYGDQSLGYTETEDFDVTSSYEGSDTTVYDDDQDREIPIPAPTQQGIKGIFD